MKTGIIGLRVADFIKQFPPFSFFSPEEITLLSNSGRVTFHEAEETLFSEGEQYAPYVFVIQEGGVSLSKNDGTNATLVDMLGAGDLLGVGSVVGRTRHRVSANTLKDTILYGFERGMLQELVSRSTEARRFISAYAALDPGIALEIESDSHPQIINWMEERGLRWDDPLCKPLIVSPQDPIRQVAQLIRDRRRDGSVVCADDGKPIGFLSTVDLAGKIATGEIPMDHPVSEAMSSPVIAINRDFTVGSCLLLMMRHRCRHICVTEDGTANSKVLSVVSERNLMLHYGNNPLLILREIERCTQFEELARLRLRIDAMLMSALRGPELIDWCSAVVGEATRSFVAKVINLAKLQVKAPSPNLDFTYILMGKAGRSEYMTRTDLARGLVYQDPPSGSEQAADRYFTELADRVRDGLNLCGYGERDGLGASNRRWRQPEHVWQRLFSAWVREPLVENAIEHLEFFDLAPVTPNHPLATRLRDYVEREIKSSKQFLPLMANDVLREEPPMTLFEGDVVDGKGTVHDKLRIAQQVTRPISEAARVIALHLGGMKVTNTIQRLNLAAERIPEARDLFQSAAGAYRVALYFQAMSGLRHEDDGEVIEPQEFGRSDQLQLKNSFRIVSDFQEYAARYFGLRN